MATQTTSRLAASALSLKPVDHTAHSDNAPDWLKDFNGKGWTVVSGAIPRDKAFAYAEKGYDWLESFGLGFDRNDPCTRKATNLPWNTRGGLYNGQVYPNHFVKSVSNSHIRYGLGHEQFVWDLKSEPGLIDKFATLWGTQELLVSFDGLNLSIPEKERAKTDLLFAPWAHVDQSPHRTHFDCAQGILNLFPNDPEDGGLIVLDGSSAYYFELWERFDHKPENGWNTWAMQLVDEMCQWLESKGCKWVKVSAQLGDLLLWDSRTIHYGALPSSTNPRFVAFTLVPEDAKKILHDASEAKQSTTHDPAAPRVKDHLQPEEHRCYEAARARPVPDPVLSKRARQLAGLEPY